MKIGRTTDITGAYSRTVNVLVGFRPGQDGKERTDIKQEQAAFRREAQVSSNCLRCKGVTECMVGGKTFPGCILCRKPGSCSGPYTDWETFEREADKDE